MGIALRIRGRYGSRLAPFAPRADAFLRELQSWWQRNHGALLLGAWRKSGAADFSPPKDDDVGLKPDAPPDDGQESPSLAIAIHPGAENVVFTVPRRGHIEVQAKTSTVGPGYHMFVCDALHALAPELGVRWDPLHEESLDEGFYFHTRNPSDIHEEMRNFIRNLAAHAMNGYAGHVLQLSMPSQFRYDVPDADVLTPLGPRDRDWLAGAAADGARGIDVFPWWHRGAGAHYWLGRALVRMWSAVRWRAPFNDEQRETLQEVHAALTAAYRAEPRLTYPWREWSEVATLLGVRADDVHARAATAPDGPQIGYRRYDLWARVSDEWSVRVPGSFAHDWDDETWVAWEPGRWVRVMTFAREHGGARETAARKTREIVQRERAEEIALSDGTTAAFYRSRDVDEAEAWVVQSLVAGAYRALALCTIVFDDVSHRHWAVATRESLQWAEAPERQTVRVSDE